MLIQTGLLDILAITSPIFILVGIGFFAVWKNMVAREGIRYLAAFLVNIAVPILLFKSISARHISEVIQLDFLTAYGLLGSVASFTLIFTISRFLLHKDLTSSSIYSMGGSLSNSLMIGFPVTSSLIGEIALVPFALVLLVENFLMMPLPLALADIGEHKNKGLLKILTGLTVSIFKNPLILGILAGVLFSLSQFQLPPVAVKVIDLLSGTVVGLGLFVIGGMLVGFRYSGKIREVSLVMLGKLVLHPLMVLLVMLLMPSIDSNFILAGVLFASAPMFGIYTVIGQRYGLGEICAATSAPATVISFISITAIAWLLNSISLLH
jgi:malonate transporter and related proteins